MYRADSPRYLRNRTPEQLEARKVRRKAQQRAERIKHAARIAAAGKKREADYKKRYGVTYSADWRRRHAEYQPSPKVRYAGLIQGAQVRGVLMTLTQTEYEAVVARPCHYCGGNLPRRGHGVDRIDNTQGYILGNVRACCSKCNRAKHTMTEDEFKIWIQHVEEHWLRHH